MVLSLGAEGLGAGGEGAVVWGKEGGGGASVVYIFKSNFSTLQPSLHPSLCVGLPTVVHEGPARVGALWQEAVCGTLHHILIDL